VVEPVGHGKQDECGSERGPLEVSFQQVELVLRIAQHGHEQQAAEEHNVVVVGCGWFYSRVAVGRALERDVGKAREHQSGEGGEGEDVPQLTDVLVNQDARTR